MTLVVFGIDALDPEIVDSETHRNLALKSHKLIDTIVSESGEPSTHELWPTIITGLPPEEHGLLLEDDGVAWGHPLLELGSQVADVVLPGQLQSRIGAWLLTNTQADAFRTPASYFERNDLSTVFDAWRSKAIGIPNYVVDGDRYDREHSLRMSLGDLFERDPSATGGHRSSNHESFYYKCEEMAMVRTARIRAALRSRNYELVFGYTSAMDLVGHIAYQSPGMQEAIYEAMDELVGELRADLEGEDELLLLSDHGLQKGTHTDNAMVAATNPDLISAVESVTDIRSTVEKHLKTCDFPSGGREFDTARDADATAVREQLEDLGYME